MTTTANDPNMADGNDSEAKAPRRRTRGSTSLPEIRPGTVPYGKSREELRGMSKGELVATLVKSEAWRSTVAPACEEVDRQRPRKGPQSSYTSEELESALVYQLFEGLRCYRECRDRLAGDRGADARAELGLDRARPLPGGRVIELRSGVPSEPTISRHLERFDAEWRCAVYRDLFTGLVKEHLTTFPEFQEEADNEYMDGTHILTHFTCPHYRAATKEEKRAREQREGTQTLAELYEVDWSRVTNANRVTCPSGGFLPLDPATGKGGDGFNLVTATTYTSLPLEFAVVPINASEKSTAVAMFTERFIPNVVPYLNDDHLHIVTADGGFNSPSLRALLHSIGMVENIHAVSHAETETSLKNADKHRKDWIPIEGYPNWEANGLRELRCRCRRGSVAQRLGIRNGQAIVRSEGTCKNCGTITVTAGQWQLVQNDKRFRRATPDVPQHRRDWTFGNPLTFDSPIAARYGKARWGHNEGFHGALERRFRLNKGKRWYRSRIEAETDTAVIFSIMHALAMEQRRRAGGLVYELAA